MAHPPFKSPSRLAPPRPRPRTVAASRPTLRRYEENSKAAVPHPPGVLIPHPPPTRPSKPNDYYGSPLSGTPAFSAQERAEGRLFHLKRGSGSNSNLEAKDMYECTFQPAQRLKTEDMLKELLQGHRELRAKIDSQGQALFELCGGVTQVPSLRLLSRDSAQRPMVSSLSARRAQSSLSAVGTRPSSERPSALEDSEERHRFGERGASQNSVRRPNCRRRLKTDRENLDSVGSSLFIYPSSEGVFPVVGAETRREDEQKRYKSVPRPSRFPKEVFPMVVRPRPMLE